MLNFFYFRHHLRDPKKNANPGDQEQDTPDELKRVFFIRHSTHPKIISRIRALR